MGEPRLRVVDLRVAYRSAVALDGVTLSVPGGGVLTVAGPNGAGKSSLLRAVSGLLGLNGGRVTGGGVEVDGVAAAAGDPAAAVRLGVAHVLAGRRVFRDLTVEENLRAGAFSVARSQRGTRVEWALDRFPLLAARRTTRAGHLSGGEQQLLAIARALVASPRVLLLDEPTLGLAHQAVADVAALVAEVAASGTAVVVAEPHPALLPEADVFHLDRGRAVAMPTPA